MVYQNSPTGLFIGQTNQCHGRWKLLTVRHEADNERPNARIASISEMTLDNGSPVHLCNDQRHIEHRVVLINAIVNLPIPL